MGKVKRLELRMATVSHVTSGLGLRKFQADGLLLTRVYTRFTIQKFYIRFALSVLYGSQNRQSFALYITNRLVFITVVESVYSAVRTDSLYKADYV